MWPVQNHLDSYASHASGRMPATDDEMHVQSCTKKPARSTNLRATSSTLHICKEPCCRIASDKSPGSTNDGCWIGWEALTDLRRCCMLPSAQGEGWGGVCGAAPHQVVVVLNVGGAAMEALPLDPQDLVNLIPVHVLGALQAVTWPLLVPQARQERIWPWHHRPHWSHLHTTAIPLRDLHLLPKHQESICYRTIQPHSASDICLCCCNAQLLALNGQLARITWAWVQDPDLACTPFTSYRMHCKLSHPKRIRRQRHGQAALGYREPLCHAPGRPKLLESFA